MPGKIKVKVLAGRNLPVMDRASDTTDAFVEIKFGGVTHKTDVCRKSLNPHWNSPEWYRFEVDESELQDEPLQLRLMDHDTYSANDAIGKVVISLAPLLARESAQPKKASAAPQGGAVLSGWIPVFDTMHGIRGELNVIVKVELFADFNKYKTSSCGVQFFHCPMIPPGYQATAIHGFVEELVVNDDPEYQWIDKIRTPRASNEARQVAFIKLSNQVQRLVGLKAAELGANAVIGYQQDFDLEGEAGVVARAIGTAVSMTPILQPSQPISAPPCSQQELKKYLDILATDTGSINDQYKYFQTHQDELKKLVHILHPKSSTNFLAEMDIVDDEEQSELTRQSSIKSYTDGLSIYQDDYASQKSFKTISEDQGDLNKLLNKDEDDDDFPNPLKQIKKIRTHFTKKLGSLRNKNPEKSDDQISIKSNSSDTSRLSLSDIKNEFNKLRRLRRPKKKVFLNPSDDGVGMASILARSVIHAQTSLACIAEMQDSETSPCSTLRRASGSEPTVIGDDTETLKDELTLPVPEIRFASLKNVSMPTEEEYRRVRRLSESCPGSPVSSRPENLLKLPGEAGYYDSASSALSGESSELYSSSEDEESSDQRTDTERSTESSISAVNASVGQKVNPNIISQMKKTLKIDDSNSSSDPDERKDKESSREDSSDSVENDNNKNQKIEEGAPDKKFVRERISMNFKFHNPFTPKISKSAPASPQEKQGFVYRSSKRIKNHLAKLSKSSMISSISHYSLMAKKKQAQPSLSQPASSSDVEYKATSHETVLGSAFLSYTDLLNLDKENLDYKGPRPDDTSTSKVKMYIGSEPASRASVSGPSSPYSVKDNFHFESKLHKKDNHEIKPTGIIHTAMETILIDKVHSLLIPTSPEPLVANVEKKFFDDVHQKLEFVEEAQKESAKLVEKKKLIRQDSIHSVDSSAKMSSDLNIIPSVTASPMLQHFHPILSGVPKHLETIPSLPESVSLDKCQSLDVDGIDACEKETNSVLCDNTHAACSAIVGRSERDRDRASPRHSRHESYGREPAAAAVVSPAAVQNASLNASSTPVGMHRRSSDSDLSVTPKGGSFNTSGNAGSGGGAILRPSMNSNNLDLLEYPFLTMREFPPGFIVHLGGVVCARSVKLSEGGGDSAGWWAELRTELRAHARALRCDVVLDYAESAAICEDVCVLSVSGTAAVINLDCDFSVDSDPAVSAPPPTPDEYCRAAHAPYSFGDTLPKPELEYCNTCRRARVPSVLLATCSKPPRLVCYGKAVLLTAVAGRVRRAPPQSEPGARDISDQLPFLEYELHKLLLAKLRMQGANAIFNLKTHIAVGERCVIALASGTAYKLAALPAPIPPRIKASENDKDAADIQKALLEAFAANKLANGYDQVPELSSIIAVLENEELPSLDLGSDRDAALMELDEAEDVETARWLCARLPPPSVYTGEPPHLAAPPHAFVQWHRSRVVSWPQGVTRGALAAVQCALSAAVYKLRRLGPAAVAGTRVAVDLPEDEIQIMVSGTAIKLQDPKEHSDSANTNANANQSHHEGYDEIFALDEEQNPKVVEEEKTAVNGQGPPIVSLSTLPTVISAKRVKRICALRLLFVRETTAVRELGGLSGFVHTFTCEVLAIVRAYTAALGGNCLTSFYMTQLMLQDNAHKNQGQCLLSIGGDVVHITY